MYLSKKTYVKNWDHFPPERRTKVTVKLAGKPHPHIDPKKVTYITEEVGYWRKANAIHKWFVDHCQDGRDECQEAYVDQSQLQELLDTCILVRDNSRLEDGLVKNGYTFTEDMKKKWFEEKGQVIVDSSVAAELLPSQEGFFFGGTDYDQYYMDDINNTIEILQKIFKDVDEQGNLTGDYYYQSSW